MAEKLAAQTGAKQDVVVVGKPVTEKSGTISVVYNPGPGDPKKTEVFGKTMWAGESTDIPAKYADKVGGNPYLSITGEKPEQRPEAIQPEEQQEATFDENVARERSAEYLNGRPLFANSSPGEAERVARAQQAATELKAAQEDEDADKPRRGRPPNKH